MREGILELKNVIFLKKYSFLHTLFHITVAWELGLDVVVINNMKQSGRG